MERQKKPRIQLNDDAVWKIRLLDVFCSQKTKGEKSQAGESRDRLLVLSEALEQVVQGQQEESLPQSLWNRGLEFCLNVAEGVDNVENNDKDFVEAFGCVGKFLRQMLLLCRQADISSDSIEILINLICKISSILIKNYFIPVYESFEKGEQVIEKASLLINGRQFNSSSTPLFDCQNFPNKGAGFLSSFEAVISACVLWIRCQTAFQLRIAPKRGFNLVVNELLKRGVLPLLGASVGLRKILAFLLKCKSDYCTDDAKHLSSLFDFIVERLQNSATAIIDAALFSHQVNFEAFKGVLSAALVADDELVVCLDAAAFKRSEVVVWQASAVSLIYEALSKGNALASLAKKESSCRDAHYNALFAYLSVCFLAPNIGALFVHSHNNCYGGGKSVKDTAENEGKKKRKSKGWMEMAVFFSFARFIAEGLSFKEEEINEKPRTKGRIKQPNVLLEVFVQKLVSAEALIDLLCHLRNFNIYSPNESLGAASRKFLDAQSLIILKQLCSSSFHNAKKSPLASNEELSLIASSFWTTLKELISTEPSILNDKLELIIEATAVAHLRACEGNPWSAKKVDG